MVGCYFLASQTQETETVQEESGTFELTAKTAEAIATLAWTADDTEYSFTLTDGVWYKTGNTAYCTPNAGCPVLGYLSSWRSASCRSFLIS